ncbi:MAG: hypothetical protein GY754_07465 [bacterium]|nr:hypothetical protein [bacterium]
MDLFDFSITRSWQAVLVLSIISAIFGSFLISTVKKAWNRLKLLKRFKKGSLGETKAKHFLEKNGFEIIGEEAEISPYFLVNGIKQFFKIRADFIVRKNNRKGIVEVKTGEKAVNPAWSPTRRQVFEYSHYYQADDIYLFNADTGTLQTIHFLSHDAAEKKPQPQSRSTGMWLKIWAAGFIVGVSAGILIVKLITQ